MYGAVRLFEARTILEDLAVIARLKRLGVRGDTVFHREDGELGRRDIDEVTGGGALRLVQLDSLGDVRKGGDHLSVLRDHFRDLGQARTNFDFLLRAWEDKNATERGALLGRIAKLVPEVADGLEAVKLPPVLDHLTAEDLNEIVQKHRGLFCDYGAVAEVILAEANHLGARHKILPLLVKTIVAIRRLLDQQVLFCPKPLHGEKAYQEWVDKVNAANRSIEAAGACLEKLTNSPIWVAS